MAHSHLFQADDGAANVPGEHTAWDEWVGAERTRNWCHEDPLLDWLQHHGEVNGFTSDTQQPGYDERTDFIQFVFRKGVEFETAVMHYLGDRYTVVEIAEGHLDARSADAIGRTWEAMCAGSEIIAKAPLWNPESQTYGIADLLVRSDVLERIFPGTLSPEQASEAALDIPGSGWHYRVVDIKFSTLHLLKDGHASTGHMAYAAQVWIYNEALGRLQGLFPESAYLLGRGWKTSSSRGNSAFERLARVDRAYAHKSKGALSDIVGDACNWVRRARCDGADWSVSPQPSVSELRPNMRNAEDYPWHAAKAKIAIDLEDLTILPRVNPVGRDGAIAAGLTRWTDPGCSAEACGIRGKSYIPKVDAVIAANHSPEDGPLVFPATVRANEPLWREPRPAEFFVDFETVNDIDDDLAAFPEKNGQALIFMIGCGQVVDGAWEFEVFTADRLTEAAEAQIITRWLEHMAEACAARGCDLNEARMFHWSPAEVSTLHSAYNSASERQGFPTWGTLPWVDLLGQVVRAEPVTVRGAFNFGLKSIAKAMSARGLIDTTWGDGPTDGLGAMVSAWWCNQEARRTESSMRDLPLMREVEAYNEVDCKVMAEILGFLRRKR